MTTWLFTNELLEVTDPDNASVEVSEGFVRLPTTEGLPPVDVYAFGRGLGVAYGDLTQPPEGFSKWPESVPVSIRAQRIDNGSLKGSPRRFNLTLDHGTSARAHWGQPVGMADGWAQEWYRWLLRGSGRVPESVYNEGWDMPYDSEQTESTGSGRLFTMRCPAAVVVAVKAGEVTTEAASLDRWSEQQGQRGCQYYFSDRDYEPYTAQGVYYCGRGYRKLGGGYRDLYSSPLPEFFTEGAKGWMVPHAKHGTIQAEIASAYLLNDYMALRSAIHTVQGMGSHIMRGEKLGTRDYGRMFLCLAEMAPAIANAVPGTENMQSLLISVLERLKAANRGGLSAPDNGETAEGSGHLLNADVREWCAGLNPPVTDDGTIQALARSDATWYMTQLIYGLESLLHLWDAYGLPVPQEAVNQLDMAVTALATAARSHLSIDLPPGSPPQTPVTGYPEEVSATPMPSLLRLTEGGTQMSSLNNGVFPRFLVPVIALVARRHGQEFWDRVAPAYEHMKTHGAWNGSYESWALENLEALTVLPWEGSQ